MKTITLSAILLTALAAQAHASSSEAWAALDKAVVASCTQASGLKNRKRSALPRNSMTGWAMSPYSFKASTRNRI